jgi:signal transduction histidine kinase
MKSFADVVRLPAPNRQPGDVMQLVKEITLLMREEFASREIVIEWDVQTPLEDIPIDQTQIEQVLVNVLKNAAEAIGSHGVITIRTGNQGRKRFLTIEDTGSGIAPEAKANLFTPFFSTKEYGQGIGLTLVQEILDNHKFEFALESETGQPTRFTIYF